MKTLKNICREDQLLLLCSVKSPSTLAEEKISQLCSPKLNWKYLVKQSINQGVTSLLYKNLATICRDKIPLVHLNRMRKVYQNNLKHNLVLSVELEKLTSVFKSERIKFISLKGPCLAQEIYRDLALRPSSDLDILVKPQNFESVDKILKKQKYVLKSPESKVVHPVHDVYIHQDLGVVLELHRGFNRKQTSFEFNPNSVWGNVRNISLGNTSVPILGKRDLYLYLCVHFDSVCTPYGEFLKWLVDLAELGREMNEPDIRESLIRAEEMGRKRFMALCILLCHDLLNLKVSPKLLNDLRSIPEVEKLNNNFVSNLFIDKGRFIQVHRLSLNLAYREKWSHKLRFLMGYIKPDEKDFAVASLPQFFSFAYYIIRPVRILLKYRFRVMYLFR